MSNYWSCSKFSDWLRGTPSLECGSGQEWRDWEKTAQEKHPFRYWLAEEGLDKLQDIVMFIPDKIYAAKYWFVNRFITKTHTLTSKLPKGQWHELDERILHCLFEELVNFVEKEKSWMMLISDKENDKKYNAPWNATGWFRWRTWRSPAAGLDYIDWETTLTKNETWGLSQNDPEYGKPTDQAIKAQEISELYHWWKYSRPNRKEPYDASGWSAICDKRREKNGSWFNCDENEQEREESDKALKLANKIEQEYYDEDTEMMIKLIKIRNCLWT